MSYGTEAPVLDFEGSMSHASPATTARESRRSWMRLRGPSGGRARKTVGRLNPAPDLLRTSEREMSVEFEFDVEGDRYRVLRTYTETGRGAKTHLELHGRSAEDKEYRALSAATLRETSERIIQVTGLDYETFINSGVPAAGQKRRIYQEGAGQAQGGAGQYPQPGAL